MTMRVAIVNPVWTPSARTPEETLQRFQTLTGWASAVAAAGATVTVHQRFSSSSTLEHRGVTYAFVDDDGYPTPSGRSNESDAAHAERWGSLACHFTNYVALLLTYYRGINHSGPKTTVKLS